MTLEKKIKLDKRSKYLRSLVVRSLLGGGRGHMGSAMSLIEILRVLYDNVANINKKNFKKKIRDRVILSKGHGCLALYAILADKNFINKKELDKASRINSILGGHPESSKVKGVEASTGSLGHGLPIGVGLALAAKISKLDLKISAKVGPDGKLFGQEFSIKSISFFRSIKICLNSFALLLLHLFKRFFHSLISRLFSLFS